MTPDTPRSAEQCVDQSADKCELKLGVMIREDHMRSRMRIFDGVLDYCLEQSGLQAFLIPIRSDGVPDPELIASVDGLVAWASPEDRWLKELWKAGMPVVNCNNSFLGELPSASGGKTQELAYYFLRSLGRKTIGYVTSLEHHAACPEDLTWFSEESKRAGLNWREFKDVQRDPCRHPEHMLVGTGEEALEKFLNDLPKPAALWCAHDEMAALVWRKADRMGIQVPEEIALLGVGDHACAVFSTLGTTTLKIPEVRLGQEAARLVHSQLCGKEPLASDFVSHPEPGVVVIERVSTGGTNPITRGIYRAWRLLENYPPEGLTVENLIDESKVSRVGFYKQFEKAFGMPPGKAIRMARARKAKEYLLSTDMPISEVGVLCGFSGESDFSNFFKRETGHAPKVWRQQSQDPFGSGMNDVHQPPKTLG